MVGKSNLFLAAALVLLSGCVTWTKGNSSLMETKATYAPKSPEYSPPKRAQGSLWSDLDGVRLYSDRRARKVGDIITVRIVEDPEAELKANTKTSRSSSMAAKLKFLGYMKALADRNSRLAQKPGEDDLIKASLASSFDGKGSSDRDGHVKAYVSAVILKVLPNGNLYIDGKREIRVNSETQYICISGIIRPEDISPTNEISSTYVANARIIYSGRGPVSDKQKPG